MKNPFFLKYLLVFIIFIFHPPLVHADNQASIDKGNIAFFNGDFAQAAQHFQCAAEIYKSENKLYEQIEALFKLAETCQALGQYDEAETTIKTALKLALSTENQSLLANIRGALGQLLMLQGNYDVAEDYFNNELKKLNKKEYPAETAAILNATGNLMVIKKDYEGAIVAYQEAGELAKQSDHIMLQIKCGLNEARAYSTKSDYQKCLNLVNVIFKKIDFLKDSYEKAYSFISVGQIIAQLQESDINDLNLIELSYNSFQKAANIAENIKNPKAASYALGYIGQLYEKEYRYSEALQLTRQAMATAHQADDLKSLWQWQWQSGRILRNMNDINGAISACFQAVYNLGQIRQRLSENCARDISFSFGQTVKPLYEELADLLLQRSANGKESTEQVKEDIINARVTIEQLKVSEIQDYFQNECVTALKTSQTDIERMPLDQTAVIYPILFQDRIELLVNLPPDDLRQITVPVSRKKMSTCIKIFRRQLEESGDKYLKTGQKLYEWLIKPLENLLKNQPVHTLIFVPDGELRTIPFSALNDGKNFLITQYAIGVTPGLSLTVPKHFSSQEDSPILFCGLTESVEGFPALPNVDYEIEGVQQFRKCIVLKNRNFTLENAEKELTTTPYSVIHIASHGQFASDPQKTFLLTYNGHLNMNHLEQMMDQSRFRKKPVELLVLSACQTAAGDERASLGLAGAAVKTGAHSVLASLWFISDSATSRLMTDFYKLQAESPSLSKAQALQQAQIHLMHQEKYQHPTYWAPFLLIGNWL